MKDPVSRLPVLVGLHHHEEQKKFASDPIATENTTRHRIEKFGLSSCSTNP